MKLDLPDGEIARRYAEEGETTRALARAYGVSQATIQSRLAAAGVSMRGVGPRRSGPVLYLDQDGYLLTRDRAGHILRVHRTCWEACHGPIPGGHVIHHINGDVRDNRIDNLACMLWGEHTALHRVGRGINLPVTEMVVRYKAGETVREVAAAYGVSIETAWRRLVGAGCPMRPAIPRPRKRTTIRPGHSVDTVTQH